MSTSPKAEPVRKFLAKLPITMTKPRAISHLALILSSLLSEFHFVTNHAKRTRPTVKVNARVPPIDGIAKGDRKQMIIENENKAGRLMSRFVRHTELTLAGLSGGI